MLFRPPVECERASERSGSRQSGADGRSAGNLNYLRLFPSKSPAGTGSGHFTDAENDLAQMEGRYHGLLEAAPDAMVVVNPAGGILLMNLQAEKQFGYRRDELVGQQVTNCCC